MQEIHKLHNGVLGFLLACHILKCDTGFILHIHLGTALADTADAADSAALTDHAEQKPHDQINQSEGKDVRNDEVHEGRALVDDLPSELDVVVKKELRQRLIVHDTGVIILHNLVRGGHRFNDDPVIVRLDLDFLDVIVLHHLDKLVVGDFLMLQRIGVVIDRHVTGDKYHSYDYRNDNPRGKTFLSAAFAVFLFVVGIILHVFVPFFPNLCFADNPVCRFPSAVTIKRDVCCFPSAVMLPRQARLRLHEAPSRYRRE